MQHDDATARTTREIGQRIRRARLASGMTLSTLAERTQLSEGFLSKLERGQASSSIANLIQIVAALSLSLNDLFVDEDSAPARTSVSVHRRSSPGGFTEIESTGYRWKALAGGAALDRIEVFHLVFPEENRMEALVSHPGQEHCYVLSGEVIFHVAGEEHRLRAGDGIFIDSELPHRAENGGLGEAHVLMTVTKGEAEAGRSSSPIDWWRLNGVAARRVTA
ncbi:helix-turn-helix domain-containing protein [Enterovirga rhinocerotis]|uniref:XRE family transcriptional regulator n=1 Tax=Enterovirga rhinocerotis TaxID=1339210 RepID=A0A4R7C975_9HYPH|nr:cupin domain-containing protein [Enterovirga rhinocerotis]TDR94582.1 XRE family transcriptional regulator [Enterovirga rhinocerotis]